MSGRSRLISGFAVPDLALAMRGTVTVELFEAQPMQENRIERTTPESILSGILGTPTVWMDFAVGCARNPEPPFPETRRLPGTPAQAQRRRPPAIGDRRLRGLLYDATTVDPCALTPTPGEPTRAKRFTSRTARAKARG